MARGSGAGESRVFCLFGGGGNIEGETSELDAVGFSGVGVCGAGVCGVGVRGVEGGDCTPGEEPPIKFLLAYIKAEE